MAQAEQEVGTTAQLFFYDWEANALTPTGQTAASGLPAQDTSAPGDQPGRRRRAGKQQHGRRCHEFLPGSGAGVETALREEQPKLRAGSEYFMFGAPGSSACKAQAAANKTKLQAGLHCFVAGPLQVATNTPRATAIQQLEQGVPKAQTAGAQVLVVKQGTVVLQASPNNFAKWPKFGSPSAGYYVLHDNVALFGNEITNPQQSTDQNGEPDVTFGFTGNGGSAFQKVTYQIAQRGALAQIGSEKLFQHSRWRLTTSLSPCRRSTTPQFSQGIPSGGGSEITGGFTVTSAQQLATQLRLGALPIKLKQISESQVSSTLGSQALHDGLIAGVVGLLIVIAFLIAYYRLLGVIAVTGLLVYGVYFYALIKLIPITMTLAGSPV